jgi:hypothetical protein
VSGVVLFGTAAIAGTGVGGVFNLGKTNKVNAGSTLKGSTSGKTLQLTNTGTGTGLGVTVGAGKAPITVNAGAGKATNLNADKLDGLESSAFIKASAVTRIAPITTPPTGPLAATIATIGPLTIRADCIADSGITQEVNLWATTTTAHVAYAAMASAGVETHTVEDMAVEATYLLARIDPAQFGDPVVGSVSGTALLPNGHTVAFDLYLAQAVATFGDVGPSCSYGGSYILS